MKIGKVGKYDNDVRDCALKVIAFLNRKSLLNDQNEGWKKRKRTLPTLALLKTREFSST